MRQRISNIIRYQKNYCKLLAYFLAMITKQQVSINYIEDISIKIHANIYIYIYIYIYILSDMKKIIGIFQ